MDSHIASFLYNLIKSILTNFAFIVPKEGTNFSHIIIEWTTCHTYISIRFCLMLFDSNTFNVEPFLAFSFTLHHSGVLVGLAKPTYTIFLEIFNKGSCFDSCFYHSFCSLDFLELSLSILLGLAPHSRITIVRVAFLFLLGLHPQILLSVRGDVWKEVKTVWLPFSFVWTLHLSFLIDVLALLLSLLLLMSQHCQKLFRFPGLQFHTDNGNRLQNGICNSFPWIYVCILFLQKPYFSNKHCDFWCFNIQIRKLSIQGFFLLKNFIIMSNESLNLS